MIEKLLYLLATVIAVCFVMVLHELPKTFAYKRQEKKKGKGMNILQYIDPIGLIFAVTGYCGFSKPYMYHVKNKKTNLVIGYTGLISLFFLFVVCMAGCKFLLGPAVTYYSNSGVTGYVIRFAFWVVQYMAVISIGMLLTNLFPIVPFDMSNLIAGYSTPKFISIMQNDYQIKMIYFLVMILGVIKTFSVQIFLFLYSL